MSGFRVLWTAGAVGLCFLVPACASVPETMVGLERTVSFDDQNSDKVLELQPTDYGARLQHVAGHTLGRFTLKEHGWEIDGKADGFVAVGSGEDHGLQLLDAPDGKLLYRLRSEPDGDIKLEDADRNLLFKIKRRDNGFKIVDAGGRLYGRVRVTAGKISIRDASETTVLSTKDPIPPEAMACFVLDLPVEYQMGLGLGIMQFGAATL